VTTERPEVAYFCSHDGYHPLNRGDWCELGCGSDYNRMIAVPQRHVDKLVEQLREERDRLVEVEKAARKFVYPEDDISFTAQDEHFQALRKALASLLVREERKHTQQCDDHRFIFHVSTGDDADCICGLPEREDG
jgi:hypothetical protein